MTSIKSSVRKPSRALVRQTRVAEQTARYHLRYIGSAQQYVSTGAEVVSCAQDERLGEAVSVLTGHQLVVSFVEFCPVIPHALLSCSFDGTCRIWNATDSTIPPIILHAGAGFGGVRDGIAAGVSSAGPSLSTRRAQQAQQDPELVMLDDEEEAEAPAPVPAVSLMCSCWHTILQG